MPVGVVGLVVIAAACTAPAGTWVDGAVPDPAVPGRHVGQTLTEVACPAADRCLAAGYQNAASWDGTGWRPVPAAGPGPLSDLGCGTPTFCVALGPAGTGRAAHWDGTGWTSVPLGVDASLTHVSCAGPSTCLAVGRMPSTGNPPVAGDAVVLRWNGSRWAVEPAPGVAPRYDTYLDVSCASPTSCVLIAHEGNDFVTQRWTGTGWVTLASQQVVNYQYPATRIDCPTTDLCAGTSARPYPDFDVLTFTAGRWNPTRVPKLSTSSPSAISAPACSSATSCLAVVSAGGDISRVVRWDGTTWRPEATTLPAELFAVGCVAAASPCAVVGAEDRHRIPQPVAATAMNAGWSFDHSLAGPVLPPDSLLTDVSCASRSACVAVGVALSDEPHSVAARWDGAAWTLAPPAGAVPDGAILTGVSCPDPSWCVAVGRGSTGAVVRRWAGGVWTDVDVRAAGAPADLADVSCPSPGFCLALSRSAALVWDGVTWRAGSPPPTDVPPGFEGDATIDDVGCSTPTHCVAVSHHDRLQVWDGTAWTKVAATSGGAGLIAPSEVSCVPGGPCSVAALVELPDPSNAPTPAVVREAADGWSVLGTAPLGAGAGQLTSLSCPLADDCVVTGHRTEMLPDVTYRTTAVGYRWNGTTWTALPAPPLAETSGNSFGHVSCQPNWCTLVGRTMYPGEVAPIGRGRAAAQRIELARTSQPT